MTTIGWAKVEDRSRRRRDACVGADLSTGRGLGRIRPDQRAGRRANLIRVAVARDPSQAIPLSGSFTGASSDFLGMTVEVAVTAEQAPS